MNITSRLPGGTPLDPFAEKLLGVSREQLAQWEAGQRAGLIEMAPVHLPKDPPGDCNHYGWPIATMVDDSLVVMHRRIPGHNPHGAGGPNPAMSYGIVLCSSDGGKTWSEAYDLRDCMKPEDRTRGGVVPLSHRFKFDKKNRSRQGYKIHMHAIGTTRDGAVVAINNHGVFRSEDKGKTWKHFSKALRDDTFPHQLVALGPRIIDHPRHGLLAFGNWFGKPGGKPQKVDKLVILRSMNVCAHWEASAYNVGFPQHEPAALANGDRFLLVTRDMTTMRNHHRQMTWVPGSPLEIMRTNMEDPVHVDTVDFSYNHVTKRFEIVRSQRHNMELWLWSMNPADWETGKWTRECRLLNRGGKFYTSADGFHPAGAIIDCERRVQHVFIYSGHPNGPAGVFRITRTLDTPNLREFLNPEHSKRD